jgi:hypothetical protein
MLDSHSSVEIAAEFSQPADVVFKAVCKAVRRLSGMNIKHKNREDRLIVVRAAFSFWQDYETVAMKLTEVAPGRTRLTITVPPPKSVTGNWRGPYRSDYVFRPVIAVLARASVIGEDMTRDSFPSRTREIVEKIVDKTSVILGL